MTPTDCANKAHVQKNQNVRTTQRSALTGGRHSLPRHRLGIRVYQYAWSSLPLFDSGGPQLLSTLAAPSSDSLS